MNDQPLIYEKAFTREVCLVAFEIWEQHQTNGIRALCGDAPPRVIFDVSGGVAQVYFATTSTSEWSRIIMSKATTDPSFVREQMHTLGKNIDQLEVIWHAGKVTSVEAFIDLYQLAIDTWVGVAISYFLPDISSASEEDRQLGMQLRNRTLDFLEYTDHVLQASLKELFPGLDELVKYVSIDEVKGGTIPDVSVLKSREQHYIYYDFKLTTNTSLQDFLHSHNLTLAQDAIPTESQSIKGQIAMKGVVRGPVRILHKKAEIPLLEDGEILITAMTTPNYLPAMHKAAAFVTDEGGITCHAAIVARELKKPCIIGTKIATKVLQDGDYVEVDANSGVVKKLERI